jgi:serine/threonine protein kinase
MKLCPLCDTPYPNHLTNCSTDGAMLIESRELEPGTVIRNKYRIVRALGHGGMGTVYLAEHLLLGRMKALKFISSDLSRDSKFLKRFRLEAQVMIELRHPNIVEVIDLDQAEDGSPYIAMEYVSGPGLRQVLASGHFRVERALEIARGVALGLGMAHAGGVIHRDVKPENILLAGGADRPEIPKLLDFGIAAMKESSTAISRTRGLMLTPEYAAPEQWKGMAAEELDGRTDLYALGGVLHEMLTGRTSFRSHNTDGWMYQHLQAELIAPRLLRPELGQWPGLDALVMRLLAKDREDRPSGVAEFVRELDAVRSRTRSREVQVKTVFEGPRETVVERETAQFSEPLRSRPAAAKETRPAAGVNAPAANLPAKPDARLRIARVAAIVINLPLAVFELPEGLQRIDKALWFGNDIYGMMVRVGIVFGLLLAVWNLRTLREAARARNFVFVAASVASALSAVQLGSHGPLAKYNVLTIVILGAIFLALACTFILRRSWRQGIAAAVAAPAIYYLVAMLMKYMPTSPFHTFANNLAPLYWQAGFFAGIFGVAKLETWRRQRHNTAVR